MKPIFLFVVLIFGVCLVIHSSVSKIICGAEEYTIVNPNGTHKRCLSCGKCPPGLGLTPVCGSTLQHPPSTIGCQVCKPGEFSSEFDSFSCRGCHHCAKYELIKANCTNKSDTVCSGKCKEGYYLSKTAPRICQKCSSCCLDGKDENITECINQGISKHCTCRARPDKDCKGSCSGTTNASKGGGLSETTDSMHIGVSVGVSVFIVVLGIALFCIYKRRKRNLSLNVESQQSPQPEAQAVGYPDEQRNERPSSRQGLYASEGPQSESTDSNSKVQFMLSASYQNATYPGTPRASHGELAGNKPVPSNARKHDNSSQNEATCSKIPSDEQGKLTDEKDTIKPLFGRQVSQDSQTSARKHDNSSQNEATCSKISNDEQGKLTDEKDTIKPLLGRQVSQDSQTSGDGETKFRKRSLSARSFEMVERKVSSKKENSLLESEESDEPHEPIKISKHPKSQSPKEGSKVEFTCKCKLKEKNQNISYQWYKDGVAELGQNDSNLVLDPVELRHFGRYTCKCKVSDSHPESVESNPAILDVIPRRRNGIRPKLLQELDINTRDEVASLLENKRYSLGGSRQVAARYDMKNHQIEALNNSKEPGQDVLNFLMGSKPNLTVYDFCKVLKEDKIERFDIVNKLEDHFLIQEGTEYV